MTTICFYKKKLSTVLFVFCGVLTSTQAQANIDPSLNGAGLREVGIANNKVDTANKAIEEAKKRKLAEEAKKRKLAEEAKKRKLAEEAKKELASK